MTEASDAARGPAAPRFEFSHALFVVTVFISAALVFLVEPMVAKLMLPLLGGSPSVWNTSMAFFQTALLAGYAYAHGLQRIGPLRIQGLVHVGVLALAALVLPLSVAVAACRWLRGSATRSNRSSVASTT